MTEMVVRRATPEDAPAIAGIHVRAWQTAYRGIWADSFLDSLSIERRTVEWRERLASLQEDVQVWVAAQEDRVVGFCSLGPAREDDLPPDTGELYMIYVLPGITRSGIGTSLIAHAEESLRAAGCPLAILWMLKQNDSAAAFYARAGWTLDGGEQHVDRMGQPSFEVRRRKVLRDEDR
jgi:ribosomal protein S18 acetylase RimI-like enzyme